MDKRGINSQELNMYAYVKNNPLKFVDPQGLWTLSVGVSIGASFAGGSIGGGTFVNGGWDSKQGISFSVTGTVETGLSASVISGGVGLTGFVTNAPTVKGLLGNAGNISYGGVGRSGTAFATSNYDGSVVGAGYSWNPLGAASSAANGLPVSVTRSDTSAIFQYSNGESNFFVPGEGLGGGTGSDIGTDNGIGMCTSDSGNSLGNSDTLMSLEPINIEGTWNGPSQ